MKMTSFRRLRNAIFALDFNFLRNSATELSDALGGSGLEFDPNCCVVTEEGIYYITERTGMATKVALYLSEQYLEPHRFTMHRVGKHGYEDPETIEKFNHYHVLRCNELTQHEFDGWPGPFRIVQRQDEGFYYRIESLTGRKNNKEVFQEIDDQRLLVCKNCLIKVNSLLGKDSELSREEFTLKHFLDAGFQATWIKSKRRKDSFGGMGNIHPRDLEIISAIRKAQAGYICEQCNTDLSAPDLQCFAFIHNTDFLQNKMSYNRLQCLCVGCIAELPGGEHVKHSGMYEAYRRAMHEIDPDFRIGLEG